MAGPTCPVETEPPDPACAPRPVVGAEIVVRDESGALFGRFTSDADGRIDVELPAGTYVVEPQPVAGLMGLPEPASVSLAALEVVELTLAYDTGIR